MKKKCKTCERKLPLDQFKASGYGTGKLPYCYTCLNVYLVTKRYKENIEGHHKYCDKCKNDLPLYRFVEMDTWYRFKIKPYCLECHVDFVRESEKEWEFYESLPDNEKILPYWISAKKKVGISLEEFASIVEGRLDNCWICGESEPSKDNRGKRKRLSVDHCHATNKIRGLLCSRCNLGLGHFRDDIDVMASAISYLQD